MVSLGSLAAPGSRHKQAPGQSVVLLGRFGCFNTCARVSQLDSGLRNVRASQWYQCLHHLETPYILWPLEAKHLEKASTHCTSVWSDNGSQLLLCNTRRSVQCSKDIPSQTIPDPPPKLVMLDDVADSITFPTASPDIFTSVTCAQCGSALIHEENRAPMVTVRISDFL